MPLAELTGFVARGLPPTAAGVRAAGDPERLIRTLAVCGGAGDSFLGDAGRAGVDAYLCADLRHHPRASTSPPAARPCSTRPLGDRAPWLDEVAAGCAPVPGHGSRVRSRHRPLDRACGQSDNKEFLT
jgi:putative NIF3 family GTP cyclohydrolase 1 type 2